MLYQIGTVELDTRPFSIDQVEHTTGADFAVKGVIGTRPQREFTGEGEEKLVLSGQILPSRIGGMTELEALQDLRSSGRGVPVMRGDGKMMGWFVIVSIRANHGDLLRDGVGFTVKHSIELARVDPEAANLSIIGALLSIFDVIGGR